MPAEEQIQLPTPLAAKKLILEVLEQCARAFLLVFKTRR
jgi:hypothetical protein